MANHVYKKIELVGSSPNSIEEAVSKPQIQEAFKFPVKPLNFLSL